MGLTETGPTLSLWPHFKTIKCFKLSTTVLPTTRSVSRRVALTKLVEADKHPEDDQLCRLLDPPLIRGHSLRLACLPSSPTSDSESRIGGIGRSSSLHTPVHQRLAPPSFTVTEPHFQQPDEAEVAEARPPDSEGKSARRGPSGGCH